MLQLQDQDIDSVLPSPGSPPGMTASKSSKSSSFKSFNSDDGSVLADVNHFEDIGLDDDNGTLKSPEVNARPTTPKAPPAGRNLATGRAPLKQRPSLQNLQTNVYVSNPRSTSLSALTEPKTSSRNRLPKKSSTPSLSSASRRHRSPSPGLSLSPNPRDPSLPPRPRRGSWQSNRDRKSFTDLERECDEDEGDDIPEGLVLDNVPISPRPPSERAPSRGPSPSPDRTPKERVRSIGNGTPPVAQAQGSLRSPTWKTDGTHGDRAPPSPIKKRVNSWNAALAELNPEAKALTEKLEEHADELEEQELKRPGGPRPNTWTGTPLSPSEKRERIKSTPELPPLRRSNIMIDPLPPSEVKERYLCRTRDPWLPPKDPSEEKRHLQQYKEMMAASAKAEKRREAARRTKAKGKDSAADNLMRLWDEDIIPRWPDAIRERRTRELWWKGVAPRSRGVVWARAIGNDLGLGEASFKAALSRAQDIETRVKEDKADAEDIKRHKWFQQIRKDAGEKTWGDLRLFEVGGPLHQDLVDVLSAYAMYRSDIGYVSGCNTIAALLLLNLPDPETVFVALANVLNRPLPLSFYACDQGAQSSAYNLVLQTLGHKSAPLHKHLTKNVPDAKPEQYLGHLFTGLFTGHLAIEEAARLWDVYVFEGDALLVRAAVAFMLGREMTLLGTKTAEEVNTVFSERNAQIPSARPVGEMGAEDKFMLAIREAGKV